MFKRIGPRFACSLNDPTSQQSWASGVRFAAHEFQQLTDKCRAIRTGGPLFIESAARGKRCSRSGPHPVIAGSHSEMDDPIGIRGDKQSSGEMTPLNEAPRGARNDNNGYDTNTKARREGPKMENGDYIPMLLWHLYGALFMTIAGYLSVLVYRRWLRPTALLVSQTTESAPGQHPRGE